MDFNVEYRYNLLVYSWITINAEYRYNLLDYSWITIKSATTRDYCELAEPSQRQHAS